MQFESVINVNISRKSPNSLPYADCFTMKQLWTVRPVAGDHQGSTACDVHVLGELNFIGSTPMMAPVIRRQAFKEHREGTQGWLRGALASLERLPCADVAVLESAPSRPKKNPHPVALDISKKGYRNMHVRHVRTFLMAFFLSVFIFTIGGAEGSPST